MKAKTLGVLSVVTASLCCLGPIALAALGLGGLAAASSAPLARWIFLGLATALLVLGWRRYITEVAQCSPAQCPITGRFLSLCALVAASFMVAGIALTHILPLFNPAGGLACPLCSR
jgi:hypothetical protein